MQLVEARAKAPGTRIAVGSSTAVELSWVLLAASRTQLCEEHPVLQALYAEDKTLARRVRSFWDDGVADFGEQLVLADRADVIAAADGRRAVGRHLLGRRRKLQGSCDLPRRTGLIGRFSCSVSTSCDAPRDCAGST